MQSQRNLFLLALLFVSFLLYQAWLTEQNPQVKVSVQTTEQTNNINSSVPESQNLSADVPISTVQEQTGSDITSTQDVTEKTVILENDKLRLTISLRGGDVIRAELLEHDVDFKSNIPFRLLDSRDNFTYIAQSGLIAQGPDANKKGRPVYLVKNEEMILDKEQDSVSIGLRFIDDKGHVFTKTFTLKRGEYAINVSYKIENKTDNAFDVQFYGQLKETIEAPEGSSKMMMSAYRGGAYSTSDTRYGKYKFSAMEDAPLKETTKGGWVAMLQHYFVAAWIPSSSESNVLYSSIIRGTEAAIGFKSPIQSIEAHSVKTISANLWVGPKLQEEMAAVADHLDLTVDYGWLWFIAQPLFKLLIFFQGLVGNWGLAIIMITFTVKGALYPLTKAQYTSMAKMRLLQPKIKELRERFKGDRQKISKSMMELYKKEKVNPLGGCFPIVLQMPIFIALYWSLMEAVQLRHAPFILWIQDLSVQDPYYIMPILMGVSMFFIQKMSPTQVEDPMQQKIMKFMPVIFTFFFLWFPAGLVLYWLMSNIVTLIQQTIIFRQFEKQGLHNKK
ncbi:membrane protein insertase YidC [Psychromonas sp. CD1]|uniref:membrane protein insertase YidC n=1 Tax=Psychromonas sp. CD1 TaxID=1979839 RepID=UPI000B9B33BF|nr:membrane protein insertase YidC [Psychromonas sp. CD1]